ncbi:MAG TPA: 16S rRNA (uracil(1498)-N(3))-methyltransferase [Galbitalea sp.]|jgi:16S rRNA (uracil1498-N3)-methyltransferase
MANQYLSEELLAPEVGDVAVVTGPEARHAVTVSRLAIGETVRVSNGIGLVAVGVVTAVAPAEFQFVVETVESIAPPLPWIYLAQALAKGDRDELAIQAATELGVDAVIPWAASRSVSRWEGTKLAKGRQRWEAVVREATKQSARAWIPNVDQLLTTKELAARAEITQMIILDPLAELSLVDVEPPLPRFPGMPDGPPRSIILVVGPEGGISPAEFETFYTAGAVGARLGNGILRTSTAGPAALAVLSAKLGRWS